MASRRNRPINLPAPYLRRVWLEPSQVSDPAAYPFCLPFLLDGFELEFERAVTIIVGENGIGKSTLLEGIAALAGFDEAGGAGGYKPVDHSDALEFMGGKLSSALRAGWLPKVSNGWFFRAESFFSVARYLDKVQTEVIPGVPAGRRTSSRIRMAKVFCASFRSVVRSKASSSSTSRNRRCRRRGRSNF
jgi:predicted ATPase